MFNENFECYYICCQYLMIKYTSIMFVSLSDGVFIWAEKNPRGDAKAEPESTEQSHERARQRTAEDGAAGKENHC